MQRQGSMKHARTVQRAQVGASVSNEDRVVWDQADACGAPSGGSAQAVDALSC